MREENSKVKILLLSRSPSQNILKYLILYRFSLLSFDNKYVWFLLIWNVLFIIKMLRIYFLPSLYETSNFIYFSVDISRNKRTCEHVKLR